VNPAEPSEPTQTHRSPTDHRIFEQSTTDIWSSLSKCCKTILASSGVSPSQVKGIGFDATCSLAVVDRQGTPISVSRTGATEADEQDANLGKEGFWNVILWADHRAEEEAEKINATGEGVLGFVGETMSVGRSSSQALENVSRERIPADDHSLRWRFQRRFGSRSICQRSDSSAACSSSG
jgi:ribulose kinase